MDNLFSGLEDLGFKELKNIDIYTQDKPDGDSANESKSSKKEINYAELLYDKSYHCPVCDAEFKSKSVRSGKVRLAAQDGDLMPKYEPINPLLYDVVICPSCGYSALTSYFEKIKSDQILLIKQKITSSFRPKNYPDVFDLDIAIERYKFALLNAVVKNSKVSEKAQICRRIAWMYRLKDDKENELKFLTQAYIGFKEAYGKEIFPICGMDNNTFMYVLGVMCKMLGNYQDSLLWLGKVITGRNVSQKLKDLARDQKDSIKENSI